jgi:hypothetical protein
MTTSPRPLSAKMITIPDWDWRLLTACRRADVFLPHLNAREIAAADPDRLVPVGCRLEPLPP